MQTNIVFDIPNLDFPNKRAPTFAERLTQSAADGGRTLIIPSELGELPTALLTEMQDVLNQDPMVGFCSIGPNHWPSTHFAPFPRSAIVLCRSELIEEFLPRFSDSHLGENSLLVPRIALQANRVGFATVCLASSLWQEKKDPLLSRDYCETLIDEFPGLKEVLIPYTRQDRATRPRRSSQQTSGQTSGQTYLQTSERPRVLLDFSDLPAIHNGTAEVGFRILSSLLEENTCSLSLVVQDSTAQLFQLREIFPELTLVSPERNEGEYDVALRISQPFSNYTLFNLACRAPRNVFLIHDTILYDCFQIRQHQPDIAAIWSRMASNADHIIFGSEFSRRIFQNRFPISTDTTSSVLHWSFSPADYLSPPPILGSGEDHPLLERKERADYCAVLGNQFYSHKGIEHTLPMLVEKFSAQHFYCLGLKESPAANIFGLPSGSLSWRAISRLIDGAKLVIVPTFYEGFGLPIFQAMSRGKTVLARDSQLLDELLPRWEGPGRLIRYRSSKHLETILGELISSSNANEVPKSPIEANSGQATSWNWQAIGRELSRLLLEISSRPADKSWRRLSPELTPTSIDELQLYDENLRICIAQREELRSQIVRYDENLQIAIRQRDELRRAR